MRAFKRTIQALVIPFCLLAGAANSVMANPLWYNGDFDGVNGLSNEINSSISQSNVYDNFNVTGNWTITSLFSNNLMNFTASTAVWEIRTGVSAGNGGTLVASGTSAATQTATGLSGFGYEVYKIEVSGLNINLGPGTYWLTVAPEDAGGGRSFIATTSGANAIGTPAGNDGNAFFNSTFFGANFAPTQNYISGSSDFSMGVNGSVPEPATLALLGLGIAGMAYHRRRPLKA